MLYVKSCKYVFTFIIMTINKCFECSETITHFFSSYLNLFQLQL